MGSATAAQKAEFTDKTAPHKEKIKILNDKIRLNEIEIKKISDDSEKYEKSIVLINDILYKISLNLNMSLISYNILNIKNEGVLNDAKKSLFHCLTIIESMVGSYADVPLNDNEEKLGILSKIISEEKKLKIIQKTGLSLERMESLYGENSKWKWSFVDLYGKFVIASKNFIYFKSLIKDLDPSIKGYTEKMDLLKLIKQILNQAATKYRDRYELRGQKIEDMKKGLEILSVLKRIHILLNETEESEQCKKKSDSWKKKLEDDLKKEEEKRK